MKDIPNLEDISKTKTENETIYFNIVAMYVTKMLKRIKDIPKKEFQKQMINIARWDPAARRKKYNKFVKWAAKKHHIDVTALFQKIAQGYLDLLQSKKAFIDELQFFHKGVTAVARYYYENVLKDVSIDKDTVSRILCFTLQTMLPLPDDTSTTTTDTYSYNFSESTDDLMKTPESDRYGSSVNLLIEKKALSDTSELEYLSSEGFIFSPDPIVPESLAHREIKEIKEIKLVKMKKGTIKGAQPVDEIDENFFD
ncbi:MAG: hypothetical protein EBU90_02200 [Proteobacteria bacterium]|nr:hypothetical protein [Pseudomonadota bacterium]NBP13296.1 hypothetical protein [bacterium]